MDVQTAGLAEALAAICTVVRPLLGVRVLVIPEVVLSPECLAAHVAGEGPLVGMRPLMDHQVVGLGELAVAELADEPLLWPGGQLTGGVLAVQHAGQHQVGRQAGAGRWWRLGEHHRVRRVRRRGGQIEQWRHGGR